MSILNNSDINAQRLQLQPSLSNRSLTISEILAQVEQDTEDSLLARNQTYPSSSLLEQTRAEVEDSLLNSSSSLLEQTRAEVEDSLINSSSSLLEQTRAEVEDSLLNRDGTYTTSNTLTDLRENLEDYYQNIVRPNIRATGANAAREQWEIGARFIEGVNRRLGYDRFDVDELLGDASRSFAANDFDNFYASSSVIADI